MIGRFISKIITQRLNDRKAIILLGPRQAGKTTLLQQEFRSEKTLWLNGDEVDIRAQLSNATSTALKRLIGDAQRVIIDEAQRIQNIGLTLKLIHDQIPGVKVIATGSSSFDLANSINEPLTGRKWEYNLYPLSTEEMIAHHGLLEEQRSLHHRLVFGFYPDVINSPGSEKEVLMQLSDSYLYKDILIWEDIKKPQKLEKLIQALAFQIGHEVSYHEVALMTGLNNETVLRYVDLLEKAFIVFRLPSLSRNLRNEIKKGRKIYFYDVGIRNAVIRQWNPVTLRNDIGGLWENFLIVERMKHLSYHPEKYGNQYFWRTHAQQEVDYIEDYDGVLHAYEFKWNVKKKSSLIKSFANAYPGSEYMHVSQDNYLDFISI